MKKALSAFWRKVTFRRDRRASSETSTLVEKRSSGRVKSSGPCVASKDQTNVKPSSEPLPPLSTNAPHDIRRERLTTVIRLLFPSHEIAAVEWLFNMRALHSLAAARFDGDTAQALHWLEPAFAELTPASLLFAIRTRMPLEVTSATNHLADRITALTAHFFPGSSEYNAYLWLNDVAKLAELARLVREGDLPATFAWIAPAMDLAAEIRSVAKGLVTPAPEPEKRLLDVWKEDFRAWRNEFSAWQHAHHAEDDSGPYDEGGYRGPGPTIIMAPSTHRTQSYGEERGPGTRLPTVIMPESHSERSGSPNRRECGDRSPTACHPTIIQGSNRGRSRSPSGRHCGDGPLIAPHTIIMPDSSRRGRSRSPSHRHHGDSAPPPTILLPSGRRSRSRSSSRRRYGDRRPDAPSHTVIMQPAPSSRRSRSRSPSGYYEDSEGRHCALPPTILMQTAPSGRRSRSRSSSRRRYGDRRLDAPQTIIMGTAPSDRRSRSRSPGGRYYEDREGRHGAPPPTILMQTAPSGRRSRSRSSSRRRYGDRRPDAPQTIIMGTAASGRRSRSRSPGGRYYEDRERQPTTIIVPGDGHRRSPTRHTARSGSPSRVILTQPSTRRSRSRSRGRIPSRASPKSPRSPSTCRRRARSFRSYSPARVVIAARAHTQRSRSRQCAAPELPLADDGRPDLITATVKSAAVRGKPTRPKRARTALASLAGE